MANIDDMRDYIQHSDLRSIYRRGNKYDIQADGNFIDHLSDNLWYTFNGESEQQPYANCAAFPAFLSDKTLDLMFAWHLALLLKIRPNNFTWNNVKKNTINILNGMVNFSTESTFVLYYDQTQTNHLSFIYKFLASYRNSLAHGGFNKLMINNIRNEVYLSEDHSGAQLSIRLLDNPHDNHFADLVHRAINDIVNLGNPDEFSLLESNLRLSGYNIENKNDVNLRIEDSDYTFTIYDLRSEQRNCELYYFRGHSLDDVKKIILSIMDDITFIDGLFGFIFRTIIYLSDISSGSFKDVEDTIVSRIINSKSKEAIRLFKETHNFYINVKKKKECFYI